LFVQPCNFLLLAPPHSYSCVVILGDARWAEKREWQWVGCWTLLAAYSGLQADPMLQACTIYTFIEKCWRIRNRHKAKLYWNV
jgi:hypothetical protein